MLRIRADVAAQILYVHTLCFFLLLVAGSSDRRRRLPFRIPHSLVFLPDRQEVCVADRENGRIQCFIAETGEFVKEIKKDEFGGSVFAINYSPAGGEDLGSFAAFVFALKIKLKCVQITSILCVCVCVCVCV